MRFKEALETAPAVVRKACKPGKQGLKGEHRAKVDCKDTRHKHGGFRLSLGGCSKPRFGGSTRQAY